MLTKVRGILQTVADESLTLSIDPFEIEVLIPEHTRRQVQSKLGEPITLHTILYIEGGSMVSRLLPRLVGFTSAIDREFFEIFCSVDGVGAQGPARHGAAGPRAGTLDSGPRRQAPRHFSRHRRGDRRANRGQAAPQGRQVRLDRQPRVRCGRHAAADSNGAPENAQPDVIRDTYAALLSVGHSESDARQAIDRVLAGKKKFKSVADMIEAIYLQNR